ADQGGRAGTTGDNHSEGLSTMTRGWLRALALGSTALCAAVVPARAQDASNVLVVTNDAAPSAARLSSYFAEKRSIPAEQILHIKTDVADEIQRDRFVSEIERPV